MSRVRRSSTSKPNIFPWVRWILIALMIGGIAYFLVRKQVYEKDTLSDSDGGWVLPTPKREKPPKNYPHIPQLPSVQESNVPDSVAGYDSLSLIAKFQALVGQHPLPEIREGLFNEIGTGHIYLSWTPAAGSSATFQVMPESRMRPIAGKQLLGRALSPVLDIDAKWIAKLSRPEEIIEAFLIIYHESVHYQQFLAGDERVKQLFAAQWKHNEYQITQEQACHHMWNAESDAYARECRMANEWGYPMMDKFCLYVDTEDWNHALFTALHRTRPNPKFSAACIRIHAEMAGHPHPEIF